MKTYWMVAKFLAHRPASSASLTDSSIVSFSTLLIDLECKHGKHKTAFRSRKVTGTFEKRASVQIDTNMTPTPFFYIQVPQLFHTTPQNKPCYWPKEDSARESCFRIRWLVPRRLLVVSRLSDQGEREGRWEGEKMEDDWQIKMADGSIQTVVKFWTWNIGCFIGPVWPGRYLALMCNVSPFRFPPSHHPPRFSHVSRVPSSKCDPNRLGDESAA